MLPAQYHVWLAIFTPLIADKFLVRTKEYIKIAGMYAYSELQKIIKACTSSPCITNISQITLQQHLGTGRTRLVVVFTATLDKEEKGTEHTGRCFEESRVILQCLQDFSRALTK